jgi:hypothetical protein
VNGAEQVTLMEKKENDWRVLLGNLEGKVTIARHEYRHLTSAVTILFMVNSIVL